MGATYNFASRTAQPLPLDVSMTEGHIAFDSPRSLYIAIENWVGLIDLHAPFDVNNKYNVEVVGFREVPDLSVIRDIEVQDDIAFIVGDSQMSVMTAAWDCYWFPIASETFSFEAQKIELESDRIYVGGMMDGQMHIEVLNRAALPAIEHLASLTFAPALWSVVGDQLITYDEEDTFITVMDVADLMAIEKRTVPLPLDPAWQLIGPPQLVDDALSLMVAGKGLGSITGLLNSEPKALWREVIYEEAIEGHTAQAQHLFFFHNWVDLNAFIASVFVATRDPEDALIEVNLYPHFPVHHYYAVSEDVIFAFSDYSLIVIDLTAPEGQEIVRTYPLR